MSLLDMQGPPRDHFFVMFVQAGQSGCGSRSALLVWLSIGLFLISSLAPGCATRSKPRPLLDPTVRYEGMGFSVLPPLGDGWYITLESEYGVSFLRSLHSGELTDQGWRTLALNLLVMNPENLTSIDSADEFPPALEQLMKAKFTQGRFRLIEVETGPLGDGQDFCSEYNFVQREERNPLAPGIVFAIRARGHICFDQSGEFLLNAQVSERRPEGEPSELMQWMKMAGDSFLRNVEITPLR